jgi:hypothetical protein
MRYLLKQQCYVLVKSQQQSRSISLRDILKCTYNNRQNSKYFRNLVHFKIKRTYIFSWKNYFYTTVYCVLQICETRTGCMSNITKDKHNKFQTDPLPLTPAKLRLKLWALIDSTLAASVPWNSRISLTWPRMDFLNAKYLKYSWGFWILSTLYSWLVLPPRATKWFRTSWNSWDEDGIVTSWTNWFSGWGVHLVGRDNSDPIKWKSS